MSLRKPYVVHLQLESATARINSPLVVSTCYKHTDACQLWIRVYSHSMVAGGLLEMS